MEIRRAEAKDLDGINSLLYQVLSVHHEGRPDIFYPGVKKYTDPEVLRIIENDETPVFVAVEGEKVLGYSFCIFQEVKTSPILKPVKSLYLDDLCVDKDYRGQNIGRALFRHTKQFAKEQGCYNLTLNVWAFNEKAISFYEKEGLRPQKTIMEEIL